MKCRLNYGQGAQGDWGWIVANQPNFDPAEGGNTAAHDLVEHMRPMRLGLHEMAGPLADELQALGGMVWGRGQARALSIAAAHSLAHEWDYHAHDAFSLPEPVGDARPLREQRVEQWIAYAKRKTRSLLVRELTRDWTLEDRRELRQVLDRMVAWTRIGIRRFKRRWAGYTPDDVAFLFDNVRYAVNPLLNKDGDEGDYIAVHIDKKARTCEARLVRANDY